jgi:hypothetical protein
MVGSGANCAHAFLLFYAHLCGRGPILSALLIGWEKKLVQLLD